MSKKIIIYASRNPKDSMYSTDIMLSNYMPKRPPIYERILTWWYWGPKNRPTTWWSQSLTQKESEKFGIDDLEFGMCRRLHDGKETPISKAKRLK